MISLLTQVSTTILPYKLRSIPTSVTLTPEATQEHADLLKALAQIREVIAAVDLRVSEYERVQRLQEVWTRTESRSSAKLKNGHIFRKQDMMRPGQVLKHQGLLLWKTATGRLKGRTTQRSSTEHSSHFYSTVVFL